MDTNKISHRELCEIGAKILKTKLKCTVSIHEPKGLKENPDAIGWRYGWGLCEYEGSILIECKTSRADFKKDFQKKFRLNQHEGIGNWRFYMCPTDIIKPDELPEKWGLIYVDEKRRTKIIVNPYDTVKNRRINKFSDFNVENERYLLTRWLSKTENPEKISLILRESNSRQSRLEKEIGRLKDENSKLYKYRNTMSKFNSREDSNMTVDELAEEFSRLRNIEMFMTSYANNKSERSLEIAMSYLNKDDI